MSLHALNTIAIRTRKLARTTLASALIAGLALPATGQTVQDDAAAMPDTSLKVPEGLTIFGKQDPNVRRATAIVNSEIITGTDIDSQLDLHA